MHKPCNQLRTGAYKRKHVHTSARAIDVMVMNTYPVLQPDLLHAPDTTERR